MIFISYASRDRDRVMPYYAFLKKQGYNVWIDRNNILAGQTWDYEIRKALGQAELVIMFISNNSINHRGYVQREIKLALTKLEEKLIGDIYIIPVLLDQDATRPDQLDSIQFLSVEDDAFYDNLIEAIQHQLFEADKVNVSWSNNSEISWSKSVIREEWNGLPGYAFNGEYISLTSTQFANVEDCSDILKGWLKTALLNQRKTVLEQYGNHHNYGQERSIRTDTWDAYCADPVITGRTLSIKYTVSWYGAGAAHPNHGFETFNFLLEPFCAIQSLEEIFEKPDVALSIIQNHIFEQFSKIVYEEGDANEPVLLKEDIEAGTKDWSSLSSFVFAKSGIEFYFGPYQVGPYAAGSQSALVPYIHLEEHMKKMFKSALDVPNYVCDTPPWVQDNSDNGDSE